MYELQAYGIDVFAVDLLSSTISQASGDKLMKQMVLYRVFKAKNCEFPGSIWP